MRLIVPLGLLGLLSIILLILIYVLKPNYQQKVVSSTHVWKLSLRYKKKKIPVDRFRQLLIFMCQLLILSMCAFILAQPYIPDTTIDLRKEKIIIVDASANMLAIDNSVTRFERAVEQAKRLGAESIKENGVVTVIVAGRTADSIVSRTGELGLFEEKLDELISDSSCTYGNPDIDTAIVMAEAILEINPSAEVVFYTATTYADKGKITVVDVSKMEWNVAVLGCVVEKNTENHFHTFNIEVASYNRDSSVDVYIEITGANYYEYDKNETIPLVKANLPVNLTGNKPEVVIFSLDITDYESVRAYVDVPDSFTHDNEFFLYGGRKETIKVQYTTSAQAVFYSGLLEAMRDVLSTRWNIEITGVVSRGPDHENGEKMGVTNGYDFYIFEHLMPNVMPEDGVVLLVDPDKSPQGLGIQLGPVANTVGNKLTPMSAEQPHAVMNNITASNIGITQYTKVDAYDEDFEVLMSYRDGDNVNPTLLIKNSGKTKVAVMPFSVHYSDQGITMDFPLLINNIFNYFMPSTITQYLYEIDDTINLNARTPRLIVESLTTEEEYTEFPNTMNAILPAVYALKQTLLTKVAVTEYIFVKIPAKQSDFCRVELELKNPYYPPEPDVPIAEDLLIYFAAVLVALLFIEWWLQSREKI